MIKFYLSTVAIYFIIYIASGILFRKKYIKARDKLRKATNDNSKIRGYFRTTIDYLLLSFIPFIRLMALIVKYYMVFDTDKCIEVVKEKRSK